MNQIKFGFRILLVVAFAWLIAACSSMPWCKDQAKWSERIGKARVELQKSEDATIALLTAGQITQKQFDEIKMVLDSSRAALDAAEVALSLCVRGAGAATRIERNLGDGEAGAKSAQALTDHYTASNVK